MRVGTRPFAAREAVTFEGVAPAFAGKFPKIKARDYAPQFPLHLMSKDMDLARSAAEQSGAEIPAGHATARVFEGGAAESGELDFSSIASYVHSLTTEGKAVR